MAGPLPVAKPLGWLVEAARRAHEILDRARGEQVARRVALVDAEILGATDRAAVAQVLDDAAVALHAHGGVPTHVAYARPAASHAAVAWRRPRASDPMFGAPPKPAIRPSVAVELLPDRSICSVEPMNMSQA